MTDRPTGSSEAKTAECEVRLTREPAPREPVHGPVAVAADQPTVAADGTRDREAAREMLQELSAGGLL